MITQEELNFLVGLKVKHKVTCAQTGEEDDEYGVIVQAWWDKEMETVDCYVAFYGFSMPEGQPEAIPYCLRYFLSSLEIIEDKVSKNNSFEA